MRIRGTAVQRRRRRRRSRTHNYLRLRRLGQTGEPQTFDLRLRRAAGGAAACGDFWARLDARLEPAPAGKTFLTGV